MGMGVGAVVRSVLYFGHRCSYTTWPLGGIKPLNTKLQFQGLRMELNRRAQSMKQTKKNILFVLDA